MGIGKTPQLAAALAGHNKFYAGKLGDELARKCHVVKGIYDFAVQGGAVGTGYLLDDNGDEIELPAGAIIKQSWTREVTNVTTSASGTLAFGTAASGDVLADLAAASFSGIQAGIHTGVAANMQRLSSAAKLGYEIKTGALTAGKVEVYLEVVYLP